MDYIPTLLLVIFIFAFCLMIVSCFCIYKMNVIARNSFFEIYTRDKRLYKEILNGRKSSWIERKTDSIRDFSLWWNLYRYLYNDKKIHEVVGTKTKAAFRRYIQMMIASASSSILLAIVVIIIGIILSGHNT